MCIYCSAVTGRRQSSCSPALRQTSCFAQVLYLHCLSPECVPCVLSLGYSVYKQYISRYSVYKQYTLGCSVYKQYILRYSVYKHYISRLLSRQTVRLIRYSIYKQYILPLGIQSTNSTSHQVLSLQTVRLTRYADFQHRVLKLITTLWVPSVQKSLLVYTGVSASIALQCHSRGSTVEVTLLQQVQQETLIPIVTRQQQMEHSGTSYRSVSDRRTCSTLRLSGRGLRSASLSGTADMSQLVLV